MGSPYALAVARSNWVGIRAFEFVRDRIAFDPYRGVLRGSFGTLAARAGNSFDRASLLKSLLDAMGRDTRFAFAELDPDTADAVVARAFESVQSPLPSAPEQARSSVDLSALGARAARDYALVPSKLSGIVSATLRHQPSTMPAATCEHTPGCRWRPGRNGSTLTRP